MFEHDPSSNTLVTQNIGEDNPDPEEDVQEDVGNDDEAQLSPRTERLLKLMNDQTRAAL